jgi:hypothetical protein
MSLGSYLCSRSRWLRMPRPDPCPEIAYFGYLIAGASGETTSQEDTSSSTPAPGRRSA